MNKGIIRRKTLITKEEVAYYRQFLCLPQLSSSVNCVLPTTPERKHLTLR